MQDQKIIELNDSQTEKKDFKENKKLARADNEYNDLLTLFDPPTELPIKCLLDNKRSFVEDRRFTGKRAAEIVEKKFGGYNKVSDEQLSLANKQAWEERISFCKALQQKKTLETENNKQKPPENQNKTS